MGCERPRNGQNRAGLAGRHAGRTRTGSRARSEDRAAEERDRRASRNFRRTFLAAGQSALARMCWQRSGLSPAKEPTIRRRSWRSTPRNSSRRSRQRSQQYQGRDPAFGSTHRELRDATPDLPRGYFLNEAEAARDDSPADPRQRESARAGGASSCPRHPCTQPACFPRSRTEPACVA